MSAFREAPGMPVDAMYLPSLALMAHYDALFPFSPNFFMPSLRFIMQQCVLFATMCTFCCFW